MLKCTDYKPIKRDMSPARKQPDTSTYAGRFAVRLKTLREKTGLTVQELSEKLDVQPVTIYGWEQGRSAPHINKMPDIAGIFKLRKTRDILPEK